MNRHIKVIGFLLLSIPAVSQRGDWALSLGPSTASALSNSNYRYYFKSGIGASASVNYYLMKGLSLQVSPSFYRIAVKTASPNTRPINYWLIAAGVRKDLFGGLFGELNVGANTFSGGPLRISFNPGLGYSQKLRGLSSIDLAVKYNLFRSSFNSQWILIMLSYRVRPRHSR
jgi:hypothetical protein